MNEKDFINALEAGGYVVRNNHKEIIEDIEKSIPLSDDAKECLKEVLRLKIK